MCVTEVCASHTRSYTAGGSWGSLRHDRCGWLLEAPGPGITRACEGLVEGHFNDDVPLNMIMNQGSLGDISGEKILY